MPTADSPTRDRDGVKLDTPPPSPPAGSKRTMVSNEMDRPSDGMPLPATPQIMALQGMAMMEQATRLLSVAVPGLAPALSDVVTRLKEVLPRAMAERMAGAMPTGAPGAVASAPPPPSPLGGGPEAAMGAGGAGF